MCKTVVRSTLPFFLFFSFFFGHGIPAIVIIITIIIIIMMMVMMMMMMIMMMIVITVIFWCVYPDCSCSLAVTKFPSLLVSRDQNAHCTNPNLDEISLLVCHLCFTPSQLVRLAHGVRECTLPVCTVFALLAFLPLLF